MEITPTNYQRTADDLVKKAEQLGVRKISLEKSVEKLDVNSEGICALIGAGGRIHSLNDSHTDRDYKYKHEVDYQGYRFIAVTKEEIIPIISPALR